MRNIVTIAEPSSSAFHQRVHGSFRLARHFFRSFRRIQFSSLFLALILSLPLFTLFFQASWYEGESFQHIKETVLTDYVINTVSLMLMVGVLVLIIGLPLAWLLANCDFTGKRFFDWALVLPLAMPAYIVAYTYTDLFDYAGPVQVLLRNTFNWQSPDDYWFFDIRSLGGAAVMLALVLFPYVYLMVRASFLEQNANLTQAARMLGLSAWRSFFRVSLPLARTATVAGVTLVMMETMADFATVNYFAVSTLTTAVYDTWLGHYDLASAAKLSCLMVFGVMSLVMLESWQGRTRNSDNDAKSSQLRLNYRLQGWKNVLAFTFCSLILSLAFVIPFFQLAVYALAYFDQAWQSELYVFAMNSLYIAVITAGVAIIIALLLNNNYRVQKSRWQSNSIKLASTGYAIPGTVLAIAVLIPLTFLDVQINQIADSYKVSAPGLLLSGTVFAIIASHVVRFIAIANKSIEASYQKISPSIDMAAKTLGSSRFSLLTRIHIPLVKKSVLVSALLIFVESMKELPAALLLRPFDFQTLPTYVYQFASDEQLELAALGAIGIVIVGLVPLYFINRSIESH